jgi:hypothetical protein
MGKHNKRETTVTAGSGYKSIKSTTQFTPDTAPINFQNQEQLVFSKLEKEEPISNEQVHTPHIVLKPDKPRKNLNIHKSFLESLSTVYISGQYSLKGNVTIKNRALIDLIITNSGFYHIIVNQSLKQILVDIIEFGDNTLLGQSMISDEREKVLSIFKRDNMIK